MSWVAIVPGHLPVKILRLKSSDCDLRRIAADYDWRPLDRIHDEVWETVAPNAGGYAEVQVRDHEIEFRTQGGAEALAGALDRMTAFARHLIRTCRRSLRWNAYTLDDDSGEMSARLSGDDRQLADLLPTVRSHGSQRHVRRYWTSVVPGRFTTQRLIVRSPSIDLRQRAEAFDFTTMSRVDHVWWDTLTAKRVAAGETEHRDYLRVIASPREIQFDFREPLREDWDFIPMIDETTRFLRSVIDALDRSFDWQAYSLDEGSGERSEVVEGDGPALVDRIGLSV